MIAVAEAELQLVVAAEALEEVAGIGVDRLRPSAGVGVVGADGFALVEVQGEARGVAARDETETGVVVGGLRRHEEVRREGVVDFELGQTHGEPAFGRRVVLVPEDAVGFDVAGAGAAAELLLAAEEVERGNHGVRGRLPVQLHVVGGQEGVVGAAGQTAQLDVLLAVRPVEPQLVLDDRTAEVEAVILDVVDVVRLVALVARAGVAVPDPALGQARVADGMRLLFARCCWTHTSRRRR